jgi:hypothetical protein
MALSNEHQTSILSRAIRIFSLYGIGLILWAFLVGKITAFDLKYGLLLVFFLLTGRTLGKNTTFLDHIRDRKRVVLRRLVRFVYALVLAGLFLINLTLLITNSMLFRDKHLILNAPGDFWLGVLTFYGGLVIFGALVVTIFRSAAGDGVTFSQRWLILGRLAFSLLVVVVFVFSLEATAGVFIALFPHSWNGHHVGAIPYRYSTVAGIDWDKFSQEAYAFDHMGYMVYDEKLQEYVHINYSGAYLNVENHRRVTPDQPEVYESTIYVFGGSTVFCSESPDAYTLPAQLQKLLLEAYGPQYRVVNMGVKGYVVSQQINRLRGVPLEPGDIVVFFDGFNDVSLNFSWDFYAEWQVDSLGKNSLLRILPQALAEGSVLYEYFLAPYNFRPAVLNDAEELEERWSTLSMDMLQQIQTAQEIVSDSGAYFIHFLQPTLFSVSGKSPNELAMTKDYGTVPNGWAEVVMGGFDVLAALEPEYDRLGIHSVDFTYALDPVYRHTNLDIFYDSVHITHEGNLVLAEQMLLHLIPIIEGPAF